MNADKELKKDGIVVLEPLDDSSVIYIAQNVSKKIYATFPNFEFTYNYLFDTLSKVKLYIADIPEGLSEASYFYKNSSIYFRTGMGIKDIEKYSIHEYIHHLQERKDSKGHLIRMGLCEFSGSKITGMALNEAAVQMLTSNILDQAFDTVEYYGITFPTISQEIYPLICNLVAQMAYIAGEDVLFESTLDSNDHFKNKFIALCGKEKYLKITTNLDKILHAEEKLIILSNTLQSTDMQEKKKQRCLKKIESLKKQIGTLYFETQSLMFTSFSEAMYINLMSLSDIDNFRRLLYNYQDLIGISSDNKSFHEFYVSMMEKLDERAELLTGNTYLIPLTENKLTKIIRAIKNFIFLRNAESDIKKES